MCNNKESSNIDETNEELNPDAENTQNAEDSIGRMTLKELQEACEDESHPLHTEAMAKTKRISEQLAPSLEALRKTIGQSAGISDIIKKLIPTAEQLGTLSLNESVANMLENAMPKFNLPSRNLLNPAYEPPAIARHMLELDVEPLRIPDYESVLGSIAESSRVNEERAQRQLETLEAMSAVLLQTQAELERQHNENKASSSTNTKLVKWTLIATVASIIISTTITVITSLL